MFPNNSATYQPLEENGPAVSPPSSRRKQGVSTHTARRNLFEREWSKYLSLIGLLVTTVLSTWLLVANDRNLQVSGRLARFAQNQRASTQIIVTILSVFLSVLHTYPLATLINFSARFALVKRGFTLDGLKFWTALGGGVPNWSLPPGRIIVLVLFWALCIVPQSFWTGALTPIDSSRVISGGALKISVPNYSAGNKTGWQVQWRESRDATQNVHGIFSFAPVRFFQGRVIANAAGASSIDGSPQDHTKQDKTGYLYRGRSYGVGASVGLVTEAIQAKGYQYNETGYLTEISCARNPDPDWYLKPSSTDFPAMYLATSYKKKGGYYLAGLDADENIVAVNFKGCGDLVAKTRLSPAGCISTLEVATGKNYVDLNSTMCNVTLTPRTFDVNVNATEKLITVQPLDTSLVVQVDDSGWMAYHAVDSLLVTSFMEGTMWTSVYGNALLSNINNIKNQSTNPLTETELMRGISEAFTSMVDDYLALFASAQLMIANDTRTTSLDISIDTVIIGESIYIICLVVSNAAVIMLFLLTALLTKGWKNLPVFDHTDVKSVIIASSIKSQGIGATAVQRHAVTGTEWVGNSGDKKVGSIMVQLTIEDGVQLSQKQRNSELGAAAQVRSTELQDVQYAQIP